MSGSRKRLERKVGYDGINKSYSVAMNEILEYGEVDEKYLRMSAEELRNLPMFDEQLGVVFYEVGDKILGKTAFVKLVETLKQKI